MVPAPWVTEVGPGAVPRASAPCEVPLPIAIARLVCVVRVHGGGQGCVIAHRASTTRRRMWTWAWAFAYGYPSVLRARLCLRQYEHLRPLAATQSNRRSWQMAATPRDHAYSMCAWYGKGSFVKSGEVGRFCPLSAVANDALGTKATAIGLHQVRAHNCRRPE